MEPHHIEQRIRTLAENPKRWYIATKQHSSWSTKPSYFKETIDTKNFLRKAVNLNSQAPKPNKNDDVLDTATDHYQQLPYGMTKKKRRGHRRRSNTEGRLLRINTGKGGGWNLTLEQERSHRSNWKHLLLFFLGSRLQLTLYFPFDVQILRKLHKNTFQIYTPLITKHLKLDFSIEYNYISHFSYANLSVPLLRKNAF